MKIFHISQKQFLPVGLQAAWDYFSRPENLGEITPSRMKFRIIYNSHPAGIHPGQLINYRIRILPNIWVNWLTEITEVKDQEYFIDDQRAGPYALWQHLHHFREVPGGVEVTDEVKYAMPFGLLGSVAHRIFVAPELNSIFDHRRMVLENKFRSHPDNTSSAY